MILLLKKHRYSKRTQTAICINGSCKIANDNVTDIEEFILDYSEKCLFLYPEDYYSMHSFSKDAVLLVLASEYYDPNDYVYEPYR